MGFSGPHIDSEMYGKPLAGRLSHDEIGINFHVHWRFVGIDAVEFQPVFIAGVIDVRQSPLDDAAGPAKRSYA